MSEHEVERTFDGTVATNEEEARAMVARTGRAVQTEDASLGELSDDALDGVSGGGEGGFDVGDKVYVNGPLFLTGFCEFFGGYIRGYYVIQRYISGRPAPYLLKSNVGWVEAKSISK